MIDIELVRHKTDEVATNLSRRGIQKEQILALKQADETWRTLSQTAEKLRAEQNVATERIAAGKPDEKKQLISEMQTVAKQSKLTLANLAKATQQRQELWEALPNLITPDVPQGPNASGNKILRKVGEPPKVDFKTLAHWDLGKKLGLIDSEKAAAVSGTRFAYLMGPLVQLQFALIQYVLELVTDKNKLAEIIKEKKLSVSDKPFIPVMPPALIREDVLSKMARLNPKEERYFIPGDNLYLIGSAEHTLGPLHMGETLAEKTMPRRYVGYAPAFRRESGSHGKDVRGILRVHQFEKMEIESFSVPELAEAEQDFIVAIQEKLAGDLGLPYQVVAICTGDMGDPDARQIDIETWMMGQECYRETHTSDYNSDYQARRLQTKVRRENGQREMVHMNDATVFAGRTLIAIMENYQQADGSIKVPPVLQRWVGFKTIKKPD